MIIEGAFARIGGISCRVRLTMTAVVCEETGKTRVERFMREGDKKVFGRKPEESNRWFEECRLCRQEVDLVY